jgi:hypothetical protein
MDESAESREHKQSDRPENSSRVFITVLHLEWLTEVPERAASVRMCRRQDKQE